MPDTWLIFYQDDDGDVLVRDWLAELQGRHLPNACRRLNGLPILGTSCGGLMPTCYGTESTNCEFGTSE